MDQGMSTIVMLVLMFALMYFLMIRPEKKRKQKAEEMRNSLKKGDIITSIGGIVGKIVTVKENTIIIETSDDRVRMELTKWAVSSTGVQAGEMAAEEKKSKKGKKEEASEEALPEEPVAEETSAE